MPAPGLRTCAGSALWWRRGLARVAGANVLHSMGVLTRRYPRNPEVTPACLPLRPQSGIRHSRRAALGVWDTDINRKGL